MSAVISVKSLVTTLESLPDEAAAYVNRTTGEIRVIGPDERAIIESDDSSVTPPAWQIDVIKQAREIYSSDQWLELPSKRDVHHWNLMDQFAASRQGESAAILRHALRGGGAFGRFRATLRQLGIEDAWFRFREEAITEIARSWLRDQGLSYQ